MFHYAYLLEFPDNMFYVGARSTRLSPELDTTYVGSGKALPGDRKDNPPKKTILAEFDSRDALMEFERSYIRDNECCVKPNWYNQREATHDRHGSEPWNKGKDVDRTQAAETFSRRYKGNRTPAMLKAHAETAEKIRGVKNAAKGHSGVSNCAFKPWYYVTPEGVYVEVHDQTVTDMAASIGWKTHQIVNRMRTSNAHKAATTLPMKGWVFGILPRPDTAVV